MGHDELTNYTLSSGTPYAPVLASWAATGIIDSSWRITRNTADGTVRYRFTMLRSWGMTPALCDFSEAEMAAYTKAAVDFASPTAGETATRIVRNDRETHTRRS